MITFLIIIGSCSWLIAVGTFLQAMANPLGGVQIIAAGVYGAMGTIAFLGCSVLNRLRGLAVESKLTDQAVTDGKAQKCHQCAEFVKVDALRCRYCGHQFHRIDVQQAA
jgi:hypothetical protein